jgi:hypothetical protein
VDIAFDAARDDLAFAVVALGVHEQGGNQQRLLHHLAVHGVSLMAVAGTSRACGRILRHSRAMLSS